MDTYTVTFVHAKELGLSLDQQNLRSGIKEVMIEKLSQCEFVLADFNWANNYDSHNIISYLNAPYHCNAVMEIMLELDLSMMSNRDEIYERCLKALERNEVVLKRLDHCTNARSKKTQDLIIFDKFMS